MDATNVARIAHRLMSAPRCEGRSPAVACPDGAPAVWVVTVAGPAVGKCPVRLCEPCSRRPIEDCAGGALLEAYRARIPRPAPVLAPAAGGVSEQTWARLMGAPIRYADRGAVATDNRPEHLDTPGAYAQEG